jgi:hypothetical protein
LEEIGIIKNGSEWIIPVIRTFVLMASMPPPETAYTGIVVALFGYQPAKYWDVLPANYKMAGHGNKMVLHGKSSQ